MTQDLPAVPAALAAYELRNNRLMLAALEEVRDAVWRRRRAGARTGSRW